MSEKTNELLTKVKEGLIENFDRAYQALDFLEECDMIENERTDSYLVDGEYISSNKYRYDEILQKFLNSLDDADLEYILDILDDGVRTPKRMKLIYNEYVESFDTGSKGYVVECPYCCRQFNEENERDFNYCPKCGQAIEW